MKCQRLLKSKLLLKRYTANGHRQILFRDKKIIIIEETFNVQNHGVYSRSSREAGEKIPRVWRGHHPALDIVWWRVSYEGTIELHFCKKGVQT